MLIVSIPKHPPFITCPAYNIFSNFIIGEYNNEEREGRESKVSDVKGAGSKGFVEEGDIAEEGPQSCLKEQSECQHIIFHALLGDGELSCFADEYIGPLNYNDRDEIGCLGMSQGL